MTEIAPAATLGDGRYKLERRLGAGGMASVWVAHDTRLHRRTAVKVLSDVLASDPGYVRRFRREARVAAGLTHPNLVTVYDFGDDPRPFLIMELVDGGTLAERLNRRGAAIDAEALARDLLAALAHIHGAGIVHRDVKPANVLIDHQDRFRLTDFGIAQPQDATRLTRTGDVIGTLRYLAPEVLRGEPASARSDLYALGILLRDCLGERPAPRLAALVTDLTQDDAGRRPPSAADALAVLDEDADQHTAPTQAVRSTEASPVATRRQPLGDVPARPPRGERRAHGVHVAPRGALVGLAALVALVVLIAVIGGGGSESEPRSPSAGPAPAPAPAPADAPLERQLDALERAVRDARGR